jgi:hypothetical protein
MTNRFDHTDPCDPIVINASSGGWNSEIFLFSYILFVVSIASCKLCRTYTFFNVL